MKKTYIKNARQLSASILLGSLAGISAPVTAQEVIISTDETVAGLTLDGDKIYQIDDGVTYTINGSVTGGTLTKTATGTLAISGNNNSGLRIEAGKVSISGTTSTPRFIGDLTVLSGATVELLSHDTLGYNKPAGKEYQSYYLYGGTLDKNSNTNETLGYTNIYLRGGKMTATSGYYDLLRPESRIFVEAEETATADAPTESIISARLNFRTGFMSATNGVIFDTAENSLLTVSGQLTGGQATDMNLIKTGTGTMVVSNGSNSYLGMTQVNEGMLKVTGKLGTGTVTVASGAILELGAIEAIRGDLIVNGTATITARESGGKGAISSASNVTVNSGGVLELGAADALAYTTGNPTMITINGGTMTSTAKVHHSIGNFTLLNGGTITDGGNNDGTAYILDGAILVTSGTTNRFEATGTVYTRGRLTDKRAIFEVVDGATLNVSAQFGSYESSILTKTGDGTLIFEKSNLSSGTFDIQDGTVLFKTVGESHHWNGNVYIREGAELRTEKDGIGYSTSGTTNLYVEGQLNVTGENETLRNVNIYMQGGESVGNRLDILSTNVALQSKATDSATAENPTVSTINNPVNLRSNINNTTDFTITTDANSVLLMKGNIYEGADAMTVGVHKAGTGTLVLSNANNELDGTTLMVDAGTLRVENDALKTLNALTMAEGTTLDYILATGTDFGTIAGQVTFAEDTTLAFSSEDVFTMEDFGENGLTLLQSNSEFVGIENVEYDLSGLKIDLPDSMFLTLMPYTADGKFYLAAGMGVPEPTTWAMLVLGIGMGVVVFRKKRS
ncbi:MAG: autotransporter-associated beta strand repeat-containing protein [Planctomycetia bacterium]|nr:autotransporter-associated beta strand repeat-containing protein [Planctomycetia bacterium]